jgi:serine phosphatase RsbU (regulator of sigma subunit)
VGAGHEGRHLLVADLDELGPVLAAAERADDAVDAVAGIAVDALHAPGRVKAVEQVVGDCLGHWRPFCRWPSPAPAARLWVFRIATQAPSRRNCAASALESAGVELGEQAGAYRGDLVVLLVEDDDGDALLVSDELAETLPGCTLVRQRTLGEALAHPPDPLDCVLLDLGLPDTAGVQTVARLRARLGGAPLVVLTGLADESAGIAAVEAGAQDYLVKGRLEPGQLGRSIRYAVGRRATEEAERELLLADAQAREVERLERGLAPSPLIADPQVWSASCNRPGRRRALLGGDFFDLVEGSDGILHALIGDVCGHGADEAAIGAVLRATWRGLRLAGASQAVVIDTLTRVFEQERHLPRLFTTLCELEIDPAQRAARLVSAGHPGPLLIDGFDVRPLGDGSTGPAIGLGDGPWPTVATELPESWAVLLYTDGIVEGRIGEGPERVGEERLRRIVAERMAADPDWRARPASLLDGLLDAVEALAAGPPVDDVAMLLIGNRPGAARRGAPAGTT